MNNLTEAEVVRIVRQYLEGLFPRDCPKCRRRYFTFREYLLTTKPCGPAVSADLELGDWKPANPVGTLAFANCACGNTLALSSENLPLPQLWSLFDWARIETARRGETPAQLLNHLRDQIWKQVLAAPET